MPSKARLPLKRVTPGVEGDLPPDGLPMGDSSSYWRFFTFGGARQPDTPRVMLYACSKTRPQGPGSNIAGVPLPGSARGIPPHRKAYPEE